MPLAIDLPLAAACVAAALYVLGERRTEQMLRRPRAAAARRRELSFYLGLVAILAALASPIDTESQKLFWVHMVQHVLLLSVAAPLIAIAAPWLSIWRPIPLRARRFVAARVGRSRALAPLRLAARTLARPIPAWSAFSANLVLWHVTALYDLTLRSRAVHDLEHTTFLVFGVLLWMQVISSPPLRVRLRPPHRVYYILAALTVGWLLSLVLAIAPDPLYAYAHVVHRPGGLSALADQQLAGGVMLGPGSLSMALYVFWGLYRWLGIEDAAAATAPPAAPTAITGVQPAPTPPTPPAAPEPAAARSAPRRGRS